MNFNSWLEFRPSGSSYDVIREIEGSELAAGQRDKIGEPHAFMEGVWYFQPAGQHQLFREDLRRVLQALEELNAAGTLPIPAP